MPAIRILWFGRETRDPAFALASEYEQRIRHFTRIERVRFNDEHAESPRHIDKALSNINVVITLDERGKNLSSPDFAATVGQWENSSIATVGFVIGGAHGLTDSIRKHANWTLSLGAMTLPHRLAQVILLEQIYRAYSILRNVPYHHG